MKLTTWLREWLCSTEDLERTQQAVGPDSSGGLGGAGSMRRVGEKDTGTSTLCFVTRGPLVTSAQEISEEW